MKKKFLDKQGLAEFCNSFKDKFASKSDIPIKVSQLDNDSKFTTQRETREDMGLLILQQYKTQKTPPNRTSLGAVYAEKINRVTDNPCLIFTYLTKQLRGDVEYQALQIAIELKTRRAFARTAEQARLLPHKLEIQSGTWSKWQEETNPIEEVPTKLSQLENDKNYVDITKVNELILQASGLKKEVHDSLPTQGKDNVLYLVKDSKGKENNIYLEYLWIGNKFELIGSTDVDLSQYVKKDELAQFAKKDEIPKIDLSKLDLSQLDFSKLDEKYLQHKGELLSNIDLNTFKKCGIFLCYSQQTKNIPKEFDDSFYPLVLLNVGHVNSVGDLCFTQLITTHAERNSAYIRFGTGTEFFEWEPLIQEQFTQKEKEKLKTLATSRSATFVIANYDSSENSKAGADYVIKENESFCDVINSFVKKLPLQGGKIQLTEGNFVEWKNKSVNLTTPNIVIEGYGRSTLLCRRGETKSVDFIRVDGTQIVVKNIQIQEPDRVGVVLTPESIGCTLENIYCQGQSGGAFIIDGKNHSILNCSAYKDSDKYGFSIKIIGENHNIQSCSVFIAIDVCSAFALENANSVNLLNCQVQSKRKDLSEITGFNLRYTNKCNFTNCQCSTYAGVAFLLDDSSDNTFFNCVTTIEVVENLSYYIGSDSSTESSKYNVFNNCRATVTAEMEGDELPAPPFHLDKNTKHNVITSCVLSNLIVEDYGSDNVATNNVQLGAHL